MAKSSATTELSKRKSAARRLRQDKGAATAIFTGAGASALFGYPLTFQLLPRIVEWQDDPGFLQLVDDTQPSSARKRRLDIQSVLSRLIPNAGDQHRMTLVTTVLSLLDIAIAQRQPLWAGVDVQRLRAIRQSFDQAVIEALEEDLAFDEAELRNLERYSRWLGELRATGRDVGVITSNYDISTSWAVLKAAMPKADFGDWRSEDVAARVDYGMEWSDSSEGATWRRPQRPEFRCYKLHGSTNWLRCPVCQRVYVNEVGAIWHQAFRERLDEHNTCDCSKTRLEAQIVSPSFVREMRDVNLLSIWSQAQVFLSEARHWVIIGYSLPEEDVAIRALFTRALHCRSEALEKAPLKVTVVQWRVEEDPVKDERRKQERAKFESLFGGFGCELEFTTEGFGAFLDAWDATRRTR